MIVTGNMDIRSFVLNAELVLLIYDKEVTGRLHAEQERAIAHCRSLEVEAWRGRPYREKFAEHMARLFSPLL